MSLSQALRLKLFLSLLAISSHVFSQGWLDLDNGLVCQTGHTGLGYQFDVDPSTNFLHVAGMIIYNFQCDTLRSVVYWDGQKWHAYPRADGGVFRSVKLYQNQVYTNSILESAHGLLRLNESDQWEHVSELTRHTTVYKMREIDGYLYGACTYSSSSTETASLLFKWDGQNMEALIDTIPGTLQQGYEVYKYKNRLFVGGRFDFQDSEAVSFGEVVNGRVKGFGLTWPTTVFSMEEHDGLLYVGGAFNPDQFGLGEWTRLLVFDGETLTPHPYQPNGAPRKLISYNGYLYIVGHFTQYNNEPAFGVVRMNEFGYEILNSDSVFRSYGAPAHNQGNMMNDAIIIDDTLYVTGNFGRIGPYDNLNCVAKLNMALSAPPTPLPVAGVQLFPNPSFGDVTLQAPEFFTEDALIHIHTVNGQLIRVDRWPAYTRRKRLERGSLSRGVYLVELVADRHRHTLRWVVVD